VFAVAARFTLAPAHTPPLPVPLWIAITAALIGAGMLILNRNRGVLNLRISPG